MKNVIMQVSIASSYWSYYPGQQVQLEDDLAIAWNEVGHCKIIDDVKDPIELPTEGIPADIEARIIPLGGGWYQVPDGNKFQGKAAAVNYLMNPPQVVTEEPDGGVNDGDNASEQTITAGDGSGSANPSTGEGTPQS